MPVLLGQSGSAALALGIAIGARNQLVHGTAGMTFTSRLMVLRHLESPIAGMSFSSPLKHDEAWLLPFAGI
ncbi:MAG: hypothetical protein ACK52U_01645 [Synechococcaceae cyanobacterium]